MQNGRGRSPAEHVPLAAHTPPLRCFEIEGKNRYAICGARAAWRRPGLHWFDDAFYCDEHRSEIDVPIVGECVIRRLRISVDVFLSGASMADPFARAEALGRLGHAVAAADGILELTWIQSSVVRYAAPLGLAGAREALGGQE